MGLCEEVCTRVRARACVCGRVRARVRACVCVRPCARVRTRAGGDLHVGVAIRSRFVNTRSQMLGFLKDSGELASRARDADM